MKHELQQCLVWTPLIPSCFSLCIAQPICCLNTFCFFFSFFLKPRLTKWEKYKLPGEVVWNGPWSQAHNALTIVGQVIWYFCPSFLISRMGELRVTTSKLWDVSGLQQVFNDCVVARLFFFYFLGGPAHNMWTFLGQGSNPCHSSNQSGCIDNTKSLTPLHQRELQLFLVVEN